MCVSIYSIYIIFNSEHIHRCRALWTIRVFCYRICSILHTYIKALLLFVECHERKRFDSTYLRSFVCPFRLTFSLFPSLTHTLSPLSLYHFSFWFVRAWNTLRACVQACKICIQHHWFEARESGAESVGCKMLSKQFQVFCSVHMHKVFFYVHLTYDFPSYPSKTQSWKVERNIFLYRLRWLPIICDEQRKRWIEENKKRKIKKRRRHGKICMLMMRHTK